MKIEPVISIHVVAVVQKIVIQKGVSYKYLNSIFYNKYVSIHYNLTDGNGDVEEFAEEEAEGVLVELVMNVLTVVPQQGGLLLAGVLHHHV